MKTGLICASGFNLVATASRNGKRLIAVVLGSPSSPYRAAKAAGLLERGFHRGPLSWLAPSLGTVNSLQPINAAPPDLRDEMCGPHRKRPAAEDADDESDARASCCRTCLPARKARRCSKNGPTPSRRLRCSSAPQRMPRRPVRQRTRQDPKARQRQDFKGQRPGGGGTRHSGTTGDRRQGDRGAQSHCQVCRAPQPCPPAPLRRGPATVAGHPQTADRHTYSNPALSYAPTAKTDPAPLTAVPGAKPAATPATARAAAKTKPKPEAKQARAKPEAKQAPAKPKPAARPNKPQPPSRTPRQAVDPADRWVQCTGNRRKALAGSSRLFDAGAVMRMR